MAIKMGIPDMSEVKKENCILCGKETGVPVNMPVDYRDGYVDCTGQLCKDCDKKLSSKGV